MLRGAIFYGLLAVFIAPRIYLRLQKLTVYDETEPYFHLKDLWTPKELDALRSLVKSQKSFHTAAQDVTTDVLEVTRPINPDGSCPHKLLTVQDGKCKLPGRIDMFTHYALTGGKIGAKEPFKRLVNNVNSFQYYLFGEDLERPELQALFNSDQYLHSSEAICGKDHPIVQRVQLNLIIMLPGQDLPMHYDLPWFRGGANRFNLPQWLLLAMAGSRIWEDDMLPQVQGVAYLHSNATVNGGDFFLYPDGPGADDVSYPCDSNTGVVVDGIRVVHGVKRYCPDRVAPPVAKKAAKLVYDSDRDLWDASHDDGNHLGTYKTHDLRMTLVWRSICFKSEEERDSWDPKSTTYEPEDALSALEQDLRKRGVLSPTQPRPDLLDFSLMLINEYVRYPVDNMDSAWFPFNYCMLPQATTNEALKGVLTKVVEIIC